MFIIQNVNGGNNQIANNITNNYCQIDELLDVLKNLLNKIQADDTYLEIRNSTSDDISLDRFINQGKDDCINNLNTIHNVIIKIKEISDGIVHVYNNLDILLGQSLVIINSIMNLI